MPFDYFESKPENYHEERIFKPVFPEITSGEYIEKNHLALPKEIISGLLSCGEKGELAGGSKSFKTWALIHQGLAIAAGIEWWGFDAQKNNVIFLNLEIPPPFFEARVRTVANALEVSIPDNFHVWHLRNAKLSSPTRWTEFLSVLKDKCKTIPNPFLTSDPIYKLLGGRNENSAGDVAALLEQLDDMIEMSDGANFFGHHFAKGNASGKDPLDRASGSGVFQRDPDSILLMTPHDKDSCFSVDLILRNHAPVEPFVIRWNYPLFVRDSSLDPLDLKPPPNPAQKAYNPQMLFDWLGGDELKTKELQKRLHEETGMSERTFYNLLKKAADQKLIIFDGLTKTWERNGTL